MFNNFGPTLGPMKYESMFWREWRPFLTWKSGCSTKTHRFFGENDVLFNTPGTSAILSSGATSLHDPVGTMGCKLSKHGSSSFSADAPVAQTGTPCPEDAAAIYFLAGVTSFFTSKSCLLREFVAPAWPWGKSWSKLWLWTFALKLSAIV